MAEDAGRAKRDAASGNPPQISEPRIAAAARQFVFNEWTFDLFSRRLIAPDGAKVSLTLAEFDLLRTFCLHAGETLSRRQLRELTPDRNNTASDRSIDILVSRLRRKLRDGSKAPEIIATLRMEGYVFTPSLTDTA